MRAWSGCSAIALPCLPVLPPLLAVCVSHLDGLGVGTGVCQPGGKLGPALLAQGGLAIPPPCASRHGLTAH